MTNEQIANKDKTRSRNISIGFHTLLLLAFFFFGFEVDPEKNIDTQYAVSIAFDNKVSSNSRKSQAASGARKQKTESKSRENRPPAKKVEKIETKIPKPTTTTPKPQPKITKPVPTPTPTEPTEPVVSEELEVESPVVAVEEDVQVEEPEAEVYTEPEPIDIPTSEPTESADDAPSLEDVLAQIEFEEESSDEGGAVGDVEDSTLEEAGGGSNTDGDTAGTGSGDEGTGAGNHEGGEDESSGVGTGGEGLGEYDDSGDGIFGRKVVHRDYSMIQNATSKSGKIVMKVCINRSGNVTFVELNELETTITDRKTRKNALKAMWNYKYERDSSAPKEECGVYTLKVENWQGIK